MQEKSWHEGYTFYIKCLTGNFVQNAASGVAGHKRERADARKGAY
jgi:hypothetical protein